MDRTVGFEHRRREGFILGLTTGACVTLAVFLTALLSSSDRSRNSNAAPGESRRAVVTNTVCYRPDLGFQVSVPNQDWDMAPGEDSMCDAVLIHYPSRRCIMLDLSRDNTPPLQTLTRTRDSAVSGNHLREAGFGPVQTVPLANNTGASMQYRDIGSEREFELLAFQVAGVTLLFTKRDCEPLPPDFDKIVTTAIATPVLHAIRYPGLPDDAQSKRDSYRRDILSCLTRKE